MNRDADDFTDIVKRMSGRWSGEESVAAGKDSTQATTGTFESSAALGGRGVASTYTQSVGGRTTLHCHTLFRFGPGDAVRMLWTPAEGEPATFEGAVSGNVMKLECRTSDGLLLRSRIDYSGDDTMHSEMTVESAGGPAIRTFQATYRRLPPVNGSQVWRDLTVGNADEVRNFYENVLGWQPEPVDMGDYQDYSMLDAAGDVVAGVCHALGPNAELPPVWLPYFQVASIDAAMESAAAAGGRVTVEPRGFGSFRYVVLADPAGAQFVACEGSAF